ncbi:MAG TPA: NAD-dependent epimerase/dehydratase family protein [Cellulomonas sp.]|uniref:NAD-dependent epimerase/dehydratase family protein n=1 Tax=Cellulomonas sp. TaxID=40001 RepID=UPI002E32615C|nr:NAD-dependent epimerase/dehydratase family protein [Cellulomonas sp.]HEX5333817.1 NAD-dependent epimerase/dehydratase family protein [Cellulomonas sp.]
MTRHVILGKGPIGSTLARQLADAGDEVLVLSRSGGTSAHQTAGTLADPLVRHAAVDSADAAALTRAAQGADVLYNCVNPAYHRWPTLWPPIADAVLATAEATGAVLVTTGNLYGYGAGTQLMREDSPLASTETKGLVRIAMWREAERLHRAGRVRATEVRGSDYVGPGALGQAHAGTRMLEPLLAGRPLHPIGASDMPHTWTYLADFARALAAAGATEAAWGRAWHVPSPQALTFRQLATLFADAAGAPEPRIRPLPMTAVRLLGIGSPMLREVFAMGYQFVEPFVMDSTVSQSVLGLAPTPWDTIVAETLASWGSRSSGATTPARR